MSGNVERGERPQTTTHSSSLAASLLELSNTNQPNNTARPQSAMFVICVATNKGRAAGHIHTHTRRDTHTHPQQQAGWAHQGPSATTTRSSSSMSKAHRTAHKWERAPSLCVCVCLWPQAACHAEPAVLVVLADGPIRSQPLPVCEVSVCGCVCACACASCVLSILCVERGICLCLGGSLLGSLHLLVDC